jgi:transcriptional regulator with XRE-family HTH domain
MIPKSADNNSGIAMKTFGTILSEARKAKGMSQKELAGQLKKEDGLPISPQYLNDIEHGRRNPPSEFLIGQIAKLLECDKDTLCLAAGTIPSDLIKMAVTEPDKVEKAIKLFRRTVKES